MTFFDFFYVENQRLTKKTLRLVRFSGRPRAGPGRGDSSYVFLRHPEGRSTLDSAGDFSRGRRETVGGAASSSNYRQRRSISEHEPRLFVQKEYGASARLAEFYVDTAVVCDFIYVAANSTR